MKNENAFNAFLSNKLRTLQNHGYHHLKTSDRFTAGIPDFLIWGHGKSLALEVKFIQHIPSNGCFLLQKHPFTGAQRTYLESIGLTGNRAFGLIGVQSEEVLYLIEWKHLEENWVAEKFNDVPHRTFPFSHWRGMIDVALGVL